MRAGSMLAEVKRTTCLISLAIILSFSKFTRPSTVESLPRMTKVHMQLHLHANHEVIMLSVSFYQREGIFWDVSEITAILEKLLVTTSENKLVSLMSDWVVGECLATGTCPNEKSILLNSKRSCIFVKKKKKALGGSPFG